MAQDIQTLVVLMLENRSFDHMLGYLKAADPNVDGLTGTEWNPSNPLTPTDQIAVSPNAGFILDPDPGHSIEDTNVQLVSSRTGPPPVGMPNAGSSGTTRNRSLLRRMRGASCAVSRQSLCQS